MVAVLVLPTARNLVRPSLAVVDVNHLIEIIIIPVLATQPDVDGFLVGGASLKPEFVEIINAKKAKAKV